MAATARRIEAKDTQQKVEKFVVLIPVGCKANEDMFKVHLEDIPGVEVIAQSPQQNGGLGDFQMSFVYTIMRSPVGIEDLAKYNTPGGYKDAGSSANSIILRQRDPAPELPDLPLSPRE